MGLPFPYHCAAVEALADRPGHALAAGLLLQGARREVDAHGERIPIAVGEAHGDALAQSADAHHQLGLVVDASRPVGQEEGLAVLQQSRVGLQEYHRFRRAIGVSVEFLRMLEVVHANTKYLHSGGKVTIKACKSEVILED